VKLVAVSTTSFIRARTSFVKPRKSYAILNS
jgi:hypothetical protein